MFFVHWRDVVIVVSENAGAAVFQIGAHPARLVLLLVLSPVCVVSEEQDLFTFARGDQYCSVCGVKKVLFIVHLQRLFQEEKIQRCILLFEMSNQFETKKITFFHERLYVF